MCCSPQENIVSSAVPYILLEWFLRWKVSGRTTVFGWCFQDLYIIIKVCRQHKFLWLSLANCPYWLSILLNPVQHPEYSQNWWMYVFAEWLTLLYPYTGVHRRTFFINLFLLLQQLSACLVHITWVVYGILKIPSSFWSEFCMKKFCIFCLY